MQPRVKKAILGAIAPENMRIFAALLDDEYDVEYVDKFERAVSLLAMKHYDLIVCGAHFDESRSIELLQTAKEMEESRNTPFVVIRLAGKPLGYGFNSSIELAVKQLGGVTYIDLAEIFLKPEDKKRYIKNTFETMLNSEESFVCSDAGFESHDSILEF